MGPLHGVTIVEIGSIGPGPFCGMMLSDLGANVVRVERPDPQPYPELLHRGRSSIAVDLKHPEAAGLILRLVEQSDGLIEGFRPGVAERLGIGPEACLDRNAQLVYGRMTGFGQEGPLATVAGHDIDYIALSGALHPIGLAGGPPVVPLNLLGDFGGGGMLLAVGMLAGLLEAARSGQGQVIDAAMVDGSALLTTFVHSMLSAGLWSQHRGDNLLDGGAPFYGTYETSDGKYVAVGALEPKFFGVLLDRLGLDADSVPNQYDRSQWPRMRELFQRTFAKRTRAEWAGVFENADACVAPVLSLDEAPTHPHNRARRTFVEVEGRVQPAPAPRFSRTAVGIPGPVPKPGQDTDDVLESFGFRSEEIDALRAAQVVFCRRRKP
ncbi:E-cinnamoyl-CoA:R-phenyllactate CoA transferase [bacterium BMS3Abin02]|nr:E-cinnamoyl-CoA:R-phenyllactate CoA transferase [bacterium BMS3Abin02]